MKKTFQHGNRVRVKLPGKRAFIGDVYSEYTQPGQMRVICVHTPSGCGICYPVCYVTHTRISKKKS